MEVPTISPHDRPERGVLLKLLYCAGLALFWVLFLWNVLSRGPYALGVNAATFLFLFLGLFIWALRKDGRYERHDLYWIIPFLLIIASFAIYDNPFIKVVNILVLPVFFALFYNQAHLSDKKSMYWNFGFIIRNSIRALTIFLQLGNAAKTYLACIVPADRTNKRVIVRVIAGVVIFLAIALTIVIPLLSSADIVFSERMRIVTEWFSTLLSTPLVFKIITFVGLSLLFFSALAAWGALFTYSGKEKNQETDSIIIGIVLAGVFGIYLLFLWIQLGRLLVGALPFDFKETEQLVKSGFWQLLALSVMNILMYFLAYRKTVPFVQKLLSVFTIASLLLLVSAGERMGLYVIYYGFSYEKFFASYAVLYCAILFVWLIAQLFRSTRANIVKFLFTLFLWMFAVVSVFPVEQFIVRANMALHQRNDSRIVLGEMKMLSPDVLALIKKYRESGTLDDGGYNWNEWIKKQEQILSEKMWYEWNIMNVVYAVGDHASQ